MAEQRIKGIGWPITACEIGACPTREAPIYRGIRDVIIGAHCSHADRGTPWHVCAGQVTITAKHVTLNCALCGDHRMTMEARDGG